MKLAPSPFMGGLVAAALSLSSLAFAAGMEGWVFARQLDGYESPGSLAIEPLDDNTESEAVAAAARTFLARQGVTLAEGAEFLLEIEVDPAVTTGIGRPGERTNRENFGMVTQRGNDSLRQLAPTDALAPDPNRNHGRSRLSGMPHLAVTLNLYNPDAVPIWTATAMAPRNNRALADQSVELALDALAYFGRSNNEPAEAENGEAGAR